MKESILDQLAKAMNGEEEERPVKAEDAPRKVKFKKKLVRKKKDENAEARAALSGPAPEQM